MFLWDNIVIVLLVSYVFVTLPLVVMYFFPSLRIKYDAWKLGRQKSWMRRMDNGEIIIKTEEGLYFHAMDGSSIPILINKEEGERLWSQATELKYAEDN